MPLKSRWTIDIPNVSLPTYVFSSPTTPLPQTPIYISATTPTKHFITLSSYRLFSQRLAAGLLQSGLQPGDRVLLFSGNTLFFPSIIMGVIMAGGVFTGANPTYVTRELAYQLQDSGARYLICAEGSLETGLAAAKSIGMGIENVFVFDDGVATFEGRIEDKITTDGMVKHWTRLWASESEGKNFAWEDLKTDDQLSRVVALNYSSGTTGVAKGVMITHKNYVANCVQANFITQLREDWAAVRERQRLLCFLPMYHAMAQTIFCASAPVQRVPVYMMAKFDFLQMLECVQRFKITDLILVPPVVVAMAKHPATRKFDLSSVERVGSGAAPLGREMCAELEKLWPEGKINVKQGWGMTEATCTVTGWDPAAVSLSFSVGELAPNCMAKIVVDEEGRVEAGVGERGEIWIKAPNVMKGYWNKPEATRETITRDGWLRTGDVAYVDEKGQFFIVDRIKELIKVKGLQVAPAELEALLLDHPGVADAAVIGVTINGEELPRAYIMPAAGHKPTPELAQDIKNWLAERVSKAKRLEGGVHFIDAIPKNPSGKIMRRVLREQAKAETQTSKL